MLASLNLPWEMNTGSGDGNRNMLFSGGVWSQISQTGGVSMPEDIQKPSHHGPGLEALGGLF